MVTVLINVIVMGIHVSLALKVPLSEIMVVRGFIVMLSGECVANISVVRHIVLVSVMGIRIRIVAIVSEWIVFVALDGEAIGSLDVCATIMVLTEEVEPEVLIELIDLVIFIELDLVVVSLVLGDVHLDLHGGLTGLGVSDVEVLVWGAGRRWCWFDLGRGRSLFLFFL